MRVLSLFSGIGGFDLSAETVGWEVAGQVEIDPFCQAVLAKHWPHVKRYGDIKTVKGDEFGQVDLVCGGPPCQPVSFAGRRKGTADNRWLWDDALRIVETAKPRWCLFENPPGILSIEDGIPFESILSCLEDLGYEVWPFSIPACAVGAPHRRERLWILAHAQRDGRDGSKDSKSHKTRARSDQKRTQEVRQPERADSLRAIAQSWDTDWFATATRYSALDDGVFFGLPRPRGWRNAAIKAAGNAVVPAVTIELMRAIKEADLQLR